MQLKYDFSKLNGSGNCIIRKTCCIVFYLKRNVGSMFQVIPHGTKSVNCCLGLQHFNKCHAYKYSQMNKFMNKFLCIYRIKIRMLYNLSSQASSLIIYLDLLG